MEKERRIFSLRDNSDYSQRQEVETFDLQGVLAREKSEDLLGVDPRSLPLSERLRQRRQNEKKFGKNIVLYQKPTMGSEISTRSSSEKEEPAIHFASAEQELKEIMADIDIPEVEYVRETTVNVLPGKKRALRLYSDSSDLAKTRSKTKKKPGKSGKYKPVEPKPIEDGFILLIEAVPPEDYHAIRQNPTYNLFLKRDEHRRVLVRASDIEALLTLKNSRYSNQELDPDQGLLHLFGKTQAEKSALLEAASHGRIAAVRKKDGWYTTAKVAEAFFKSREVPSPNQRPMTKQEVVRYRDFLKSGTFPARKVKNRWHTSDEEILEFERANPSKRKVNLPDS